MLNRVRQPFNVNGLAQVPAVAGLADKAHQKKSKQMVATGRSYLTQELRKIGLSPLPSEANFVCVRVGDGKKVAEKMERAGVVIRPLSSFGMKEFIRITIGTKEHNRRVVESLKNALMSLRAKRSNL
jgi:histidinol-phosphate aminotransferase